MVNVIEVAMKQIYHTIHDDILKAAFQPERYKMSLDARIHEAVIVDRVLFDCNIYAGRLTKIVLKSNYIERVTIPSAYMAITPESYSVYRIPPEAREGREIVTAIAIDYPMYMYGNLGMVPPYSGNAGGHTMESLGRAILETQTFADTPVMPTPIVMSGDLIRLIPPGTQFHHTIDWTLTCRLAHDEAFTNLHASAIKPLANLIVCAVKCYIYKELFLNIDKAYITGGQELGRFKEIVDSFSGEQEHYDELLKQFRASATLLDPEALARLLPMML